MFARLAGIGGSLLRNKWKSTLLVVPLSLYAKCGDSKVCRNKWKFAKNVYEFNYTDIDGNEQSMDKFKGKVLIIVNVASCSPIADKNYQQLVAMHKKFGEKNGLAVLAFPCNQFEEQEPDDEQAIKTRVDKKWGVKFDMASKVDVNGPNADPLWKYLRFKDCGLWWFVTNDVSSNFTKFLVDRNGNVVMRFTPHENPYEILSVICEDNWYCDQIPGGGACPSAKQQQCLARTNYNPEKGKFSL